jgi:hypothetical protein
MKSNIPVLAPIDRIIHQHGKISTVLSMPTFEHSLVDYINSFGNLYYGTMNVDLFYKSIRQTKKEFLFDLKNISTITTTQPIAFKLHLCRVAINEPWRLPALINQSSDILNWSTGQGRFLATGMCLQNPHNQIKFLLLQDKGTDPKHFLQDPVPVITDQQLHEILNLSNTNQTTVEMQFELVQNGSHLILASLYNGDRSYHYDVGTPYLDQFKSWQQQYGPRPTLHIYTNWPEMISDSVNAWTIKHQGPSPVVKTEYFKLGNLERCLFEQFGKFTHGKDHVLYVTDPRNIDISDFLCWMDLTYSAYININGQFALLRPSDNYFTKLMDISYLR